MDENHGLVGEKGRLVMERDVWARGAEDLKGEGGGLVGG
jgi:hypothetical protein